MNKINLLDTNYLRPNRTIESVLLSNKQDKKLVFVYNYEGIHFRLFLSLDYLVEFFNGERGEFFSFESENDLDCTLVRLNLSN